MKKLKKLQGGGVVANPSIGDALKGFVTDSSVMSGLGAAIGSAIQAGGNGYWSKQGSAGVTNAIASMPDMIGQIQNLKGLKGANLAGGIGGLVGSAADIVGGFVEPGTAESGQYGNVTKGVDAGYDAIANAAMFMGPVGMVVGGAMKVNDLLGDVISKQSINGRALGTDGQTLSDSILGSAFFESNIGAVNAYFGEDMEKLEMDEKTWNTVGSSYSGAMKDVDDATTNTGGRYGWLSTVTGEYSKDYAQMIDAKIKQEKASLIADEATESNEIAESTANEALLNRRKRMSGQNQRLVVKNGMKIPTADDINRVKDMLKKPTFEPIWEDVPVFKKGGKAEEKKKEPRSIEELIQYAKEQNPRFVQRMTEPLKYLDLGNGDHATHIMVWDTDDQNQAYVYPTVMEDKEGNLQDYKDEAPLVARERGDYLIMSPEEAELFTTQYKQGWPMFFQQTPSQKFAKGGTMNIIPEGELHARLHHMDQEGITKKGIPVISEEEGGEIVQHAEIERNEIIFRLEVTNKLEKLKEDGSDEAAIEAGKLLVEEILNNTEDRTGLIDEVE